MVAAILCPTPAVVQPAAEVAAGHLWRRRCGGQCSLRLVNTGLEDDPPEATVEAEAASDEEEG